jgi:hypothetical protein
MHLTLEGQRVEGLKQRKSALFNSKHVHIPTEALWLKQPFHLSRQRSRLRQRP